MLYSLVLLTPALIVYEISSILFFLDKPYHLRNAADSLLRNWISTSRFSHNWIVPSAIILFLAGLFYFYRQELKPLWKGEVRTHILSLMLLESFAWSLLLLISLSAAGSFFMSNPIQPGIAEMIYLSVGAGIFEEFLFRFLIITGLLLLIKPFLSGNNRSALFLAAAVSALLFSLFHYTGTYGEAFTWNSFFYRFMAGMLLSSLFLLRGLGITVYTHIFYDITLVAAPVFQNKIGSL